MATITEVESDGHNDCVELDEQSPRPQAWVLRILQEHRCAADLAFFHVVHVLIPLAPPAERRFVEQIRVCPRFQSYGVFSRLLLRPRPVWTGDALVERRAARQRRDWPVPRAGLKDEAFSPPSGNHVPLTKMSVSVMNKYASCASHEPKRSGASANWPMKRMGAPSARLSGHCGSLIQTGCPPSLVTGARMGARTSCTHKVYFLTICHHLHDTTAHCSARLYSTTPTLNYN